MRQERERGREREGDMLSGCENLIKSCSHVDGREGNKKLGCGMMIEPRAGPRAILLHSFLRTYVRNLVGDEELQTIGL